MSVDLSFAKSGIAVIGVKNRQPEIRYASLYTSNKDKLPHERVDDTVTYIKYLASTMNTAVIVKESSIIRQVSSATPVIKTHAVFEHELYDKYDLGEVSNSTVKAWARIVTGSEGKRHDKAMIGEAVEKYYGRQIDEIWTPRGKLIDDVADAIALMTLWLEKEDIIDTRYVKG